jgi:hypothetical protein
MQDKVSKYNIEVEYNKGMLLCYYSPPKTRNTTTDLQLRRHI